MNGNIHVRFGGRRERKVLTRVSNSLAAYPTYRASQRGNSRAVHKLQKLLMKSEALTLLAVRRVSQENQGRRPRDRRRETVSPPEKPPSSPHPPTALAAPQSQTSQKGIDPNREKPRSGAWAYPRWKIGRDKVWSSWRSNPNGRPVSRPTAGFRPGRSGQDAIAAIFLEIKHKTSLSSTPTSGDASTTSTRQRW